MISGIVFSSLQQPWVDTVSGDLKWIEVFQRKHTCLWQERNLISSFLALKLHLSNFFTTLLLFFFHLTCSVRQLRQAVKALHALVVPDRFVLQRRSLSQMVWTSRISSSSSCLFVNYLTKLCRVTAVWLQMDLDQPDQTVAQEVKRRKRDGVVERDNNGNKKNIQE